MVQSGQWSYLVWALGRASALLLVRQVGSLSGDSCFSSDRLDRRRIDDEDWESESDSHPSGRRREG